MIIYLMRQDDGRIVMQSSIIGHYLEYAQPGKAYMGYTFEEICETADKEGKIEVPKKEKGSD